MSAKINLENPWVLFDEAIVHLIVARRGDLIRQKLGLPNILLDPDHDNPFIIINTELYDGALRELRQLLAEGKIIAFEEVEPDAPGGAQHREIPAVDWTTLVVSPTINPLGFPKRRIRLRRADLRKHWPLKSKSGEGAPKRSKSPFEKDRANEIFRQNDGWMHLSQGEAAATLHVIYSKDISKVKVPKPETFESWVREWTPKGSRS